MDKNYAKALLKLRAKLNLSQTEMAELLQVSYPSVNRWENNHTTPTKLARYRIEELCEKYAIDIEENASSWGAKNSGWKL